MQEYWVLGGEYTDTRFEALVDDAALESYGPYYDYNDARRDWQARTLASLDNTCVRYRIVPYRPATAPSAAAE